MATVVRREDRVEVRAYTGINPSTGRERHISKTLPIDASDRDIERASEELESRAAVIMGNSELMTVAALFDYYMDRCKSDGMSPTTITAYKSYLKRHIKPDLGGMYIDKLDGKVLSGFFRRLHDEKGLSHATVNKMKQFMSGCFKKMVLEGRVESNPMVNVRVPYPKGTEAIPLSDEDFAKLTDWIDATLEKPSESDYEDMCFAALINTALGTGCRRGELAGFTVDDLKLTKDDTPMLRVRETLVYSDGRNSELVRKSTKSKKSKRNITLDDQTYNVLVEHLLIQEDMLYMTLGAIQVPTSPLFAHANGEPWEPDDITSTFRSLVEALGMSKTAHMHTLRHTHATRLLEDGVDVVTLQERLGHDDAKTTMNIYGHVMPGRDAEAARRYADVRRNIGCKTVAKISGKYAPKCPLSGQTCARFIGNTLDN